MRQHYAGAIKISDGSDAAREEYVNSGRERQSERKSGRAGGRASEQPSHIIKCH